CDQPERLYKRPRTRFVADFFRGCNVLAVERVGEGGYRLAGVPIEVALATGMAHVAIRSENLHIGSDEAGHRLQIAGTLVESTYRGTVLDYLIELGDRQRVVATTTRHVALSPGSAVKVTFDREALIPLED